MMRLDGVKRQGALLVGAIACAGFAEGAESLVLSRRDAPTGRPSMLMNFIRREGLLAIDYENGVTARENDFDVTDIRNLRAVAMLYQTGYLTIKDFRGGATFWASRTMCWRGSCWRGSGTNDTVKRYGRSGFAMVDPSVRRLRIRG